MRLSHFFFWAAAGAAAVTLDELARDVERVESLREIKDVTATFAQLAQFGRYRDMADLFTDDGVLLWGNISVTGPEAIGKWLEEDAGDMNGMIRPGSLDTLVLATPLVNLAADGKTAKGRWNGWRFQGGGGKTRMQGGIWENEYAVVMEEGGRWRWRVRVMRYYGLYEGDYEKGWRNVGGRDFGTVPEFHYSAEEAGVPIPKAVGTPGAGGVTEGEIGRRIEDLNDEDEVRNLQHAWGYYVDRRLWGEVGELFGSHDWGVVKVDNVGVFEGPGGIREGLERWMGPEGLSQGVLNEHLIFDTVVKIRDEVDPEVPNAEKMADVRGIEIGLIGDQDKGTASWRFSFFQNSFIKRNGIWQFLNVTIAPLVVANYSDGWGNGGVMPRSTVAPVFLDYTTRSTKKPSTQTTSTDSLPELSRRLSRSYAYEGAESISNAYGFYIDFIDGAACSLMAAIHHPLANKESPFAGFYHTRQRVLDACTASYGTSSRPTRSGISFHWRPQPVIHVSQDGRSASLRARLLQPATDKTSAGTIRGGMYHDQMVLDENGSWKLWSVTIDEFYWAMNNWTEGWGGVEVRDKNAPDQPPPRDLVRQFPPDLWLNEMEGEREIGFMGGRGRYVSWPEIQRMWFGYRNPVSGGVPKDGSYWPGCVPCYQHKPEWGMTKHSWQEPPTGPTLVRAMFAAGNGSSEWDDGTFISVSVTPGPGEVVEGVVRLVGREIELEYELSEADGGRVTFELPRNMSGGFHMLEATFSGSNRLNPGRDTVDLTLPGGPGSLLGD
ncbi:SnoaL-like domain-containing protein [Apiosordaria backusii]|uniref:SnoaL-like domain-containing protein n=1 Tax=Apiosordaria backusii TaxID=314023 RepID=A0AA40ESA5_9PEZI|nr:SnoaL-like domain-containing protein [Apiosordaria backusii]